MKRILLLFFAVFVSVFISNATHIVGGNLTYEHLGGATYRVNLRLYKDCRSSYWSYFTNGMGNLDSVQITPVNFPNSVRIEVRLGDGTLPLCSDNSLDFNMPRVGRDTLEPHIDTCAFNPGICVEEALFSSVVTLPPRTEGYHLFFRTWSRNYTIDNIVSENLTASDPDEPGETFNTYIPNTAELLTNSSPTFTKFPPVYICANRDLDFNNSATDPDGDSLVYSLYQPYTGRPWDETPETCQQSSGVYEFFPTIVNNGNAPNNITFPTVQYTPGGGYSPTNPLNGNGAPLDLLTISPTGILNGIPNFQGQYVVGVKVEEYRDGVKIGEIVRDFQFNVLACPPLKNAGIEPVIGCNDSEVQLVNGSDGGANDFLWDFDVANPGVNTSTLDNPTYDFGGPGLYDIMLIAQSGTTCADTAYYTVPVSGVTADFNMLDSTCVGSLVTYSDNSTTNLGVMNSWNYQFGDGDSSIVPNTNHYYDTGADYSVQLIAGNDYGCFDTVVQPLYIQSMPEVILPPDTAGCLNNPAMDLSGIVNNAGGGFWVGSGGSFSPNANSLNITYTPNQPELDQGVSQLILSSTDNGFCPTVTDTILITYLEGPILAAGPDQSVCKDTASVQLSSTAQFAGGVGWFTDEGTGSFNDTTLLNPLYFPSSADTAAGSITIYVTTTNNGSCFPSIDSVELNFFDPPTVDIVAVDTVCADNPVSLISNSTTGNGYWETTGDGIFNPGDTGVAAVYVHGLNDSIAGTVDLIFHSLDNGGCQVVRDTHTLDILAAPTVDFSFTLECQNEATVFTDNSTSSDPITNWDWTFEPGQTSTQENPSHVFSNAGENTVELIVTTQNGCSDTLSQDVTVHFLPVANFGPVTPCLEGGTQFIDSSVVDSAQIVSWTWDFGDSESDTIQDPLHYFPAAGPYDVELVVESEFGCLDSLTQTINILPGPTADFTFQPPNAYVFENVDFTDQSTGNVNINGWDWDFGDTSGVSNDQNPNYNYGSGGTYTVTLIVQDESGCVDTTQKDINIYLPPLVPNAFSPNGDNANDFLFVYGGPFIELTFKVYNNWGEVIFESNNQQDGWDGTFKSVEQPIGNYVYTVVAKTEDGKEHTLSGDVQLMR